MQVKEKTVMLRL